MNSIGGCSRSHALSSGFTTHWSYTFVFTLSTLDSRIRLSCAASHQLVKESRTGFIAFRGPCSETVAAEPRSSFVDVNLSNVHTNSSSASEPKIGRYSETSYRPPDTT